MSELLRPTKTAPFDEPLVVHWQDTGYYDIGVQFDDGRWQRANNGMEEYDAPPTHWAPLPQRR